MMIPMKHNQEATLTIFGGKGIVQLVQTNLFKLTFRWEEFAVGSHPCFKFFFCCLDSLPFLLSKIQKLSKPFGSHRSVSLQRLNC